MATQMDPTFHARTPSMSHIKAAIDWMNEEAGDEDPNQRLLGQRLGCAIGKLSHGYYHGYVYYL